MIRREFLGVMAGATVSAAIPRGFADAVSRPSSFQRILLPPDSAAPLETAAKELSDHTGARIVRIVPSGRLNAGDIALHLGDPVDAFPRLHPLADGQGLKGEWELIQTADEGLLIAGSSPRNVCHASLAWIADPDLETNRFSRFRYTERFTVWDNTLNQMQRFSTGSDRREHIRELARMGHTAVELNRYADPEGYFVRHSKPDDSYAWYLSYAPALDAFVESSLTAGLYPKQDLERNLNGLRELAALARQYGMEPGFVCYEPRVVSEEIFEKYPQLRGSRIDHPARGTTARWCLDIAHPLVLQHYSEMMKNLMQAVPDLRYFMFWTGDSGAGLPFAEELYVGPNGSYLAKSKTLKQVTTEFAGTLVAAGRSVNPKLEVIMEIGWELTDKERQAITPALPPGVTVSHLLYADGGRIVQGRDLGSNGGNGGFLGQRTPGKYAHIYDEDRAAGKDPYGEIVVSSWWDFEPIFGIAFPNILKQKFAALDQVRLERFFNRGGALASPQCRFNITQDVFSELLRSGADFDLDPWLKRKAILWCNGQNEPAAALVKGWKSGEQALELWPALDWYQMGWATTQGRWLTRPLVPDFSLLTDAEKAAYTRKLFTLFWDVGRLNIAFEGGLRIFYEKDMLWAVGVFDDAMLPALENTVKIFETALASWPLPVLEDQRDRYRGLLLLMRSVRNTFAAQASINLHLLSSPVQAEARPWRGAIEAEIANTRDWIHALSTSRTNFFHLAEQVETPFLYKPIIDDMTLRVEVMERHMNDKAGPNLPELRWKNDTRTAWRDWAYL